MSCPLQGGSERPGPLPMKKLTGHLLLFGLKMRFQEPTVAPLTGVVHDRAWH
jgi:hypothetical protein